MMGTEDLQGELFRADSLYADFVGRDSFYHWLALNGPKYFPEKDFAPFYDRDNGRPSKPPSQMMVLLVLQHHAKVSDAEAIERSKFDLRWKVALRLDADEVLCYETCLREFRARVLAHAELRRLLARSVEACIREGVLKARKIHVASDTTPIIGRGAVKDTYNLLGDAIVKILRLGALLEGVEIGVLAARLDLARYLTCSSIKAIEEVDWTDTAQRDAFLNRLVQDAQRALGWARGISDKAQEAGAQASCQLLSGFQSALELLNRILLQDVEFKASKGEKQEQSRSEEIPQAACTDADLGAGKEEKPAEVHGSQTAESQGARQLGATEQGHVRAEELQGQATIKEGVAKDRILSVHDPEQRHGRKSASSRFDGHKGSVTAETQSGVILDATVLPGNVEDARGHLESVQAAQQTLQEAWDLVDTTEARQAPAQEGGEAGSGPEAHASPTEACRVERAYGDCAYGSASNRRAFAEAQVELAAKQASLSNGGCFTKDQFPKDPATNERICPAGHRAVPRPRKVTWEGEKVEVPEYRWARDTCAVCPLREQCLKSQQDPGSCPRGRVIRDHPEEQLLAEARARQKTPEFQQDYKERQIVEQRLARMVQLGGRQARYFGRAKTALQWTLIAVVANLTKAAAAAQKAAEEALLALILGPWLILARQGRGAQALVTRALMATVVTHMCVWLSCTLCAHCALRPISK